MSNSFFNHTERFVKLDTVRAEDMNAVLDAVASGLDGVETKTNAALKLPDGETAAALPAAAARVGKVLSFDASGNPESVIESGNVVNAAQYASESKSSWESINTRYLGEKSSPPSVDNTGAALTVGALYWDVAANEMRAWSGTAWETAYSPHTLATIDEMVEGAETGVRSMSPKIVYDSTSLRLQDRVKAYGVSTRNAPVVIALQDGALAGSTVKFIDLDLSFNLNPLTIDRNGYTFKDQSGNLINENIVVDVPGLTLTLYFDGSHWRIS